MVRNYVKKTDRAFIDEQQIKNAVEDIIENKTSIRLAAIRFGIKKSTLHNRIKKVLSRNTNHDSGNEDEPDEPKRFSKYGVRQVFNTEQENHLVKYLKISSNIHYGLTFRSCRSLAYQYAVELKIIYPASWDKKQCAGKDWMRQFMKRHPDLTHRKPENTSLSRATAFNKTNVEQFFENYSEVQEKYNFTPDRILNTDESGISTVLQAPKVIAPCGKKQVGQIVSQERGTLVTFCATIIASGNTIPPLFIFPRVRMKDSYLNGAPIGSIAYGSKSGWITAEIFINLLKHIKKHTQCSKERPILLILDNHDSHTSLIAINYCRENGIVLLTFPPHCTHRMQPLDIGIFGPFKSRLKTSFNDRMLTNPGKHIKIDDIPNLATEPYLNSFTPSNIISAFKKSGIWPINRLVFNEVDFSAAYVTDRPEQQSNTDHKIIHTKSINVISNILIKEGTGKDTPDQSNSSIIIDEISKDERENETISIISDISVKEVVDQRENNNTSTPSTSHQVERKVLEISPFIIRPLPKAAPRTDCKRRKLGKSRIFTSTPEKERLEELERNKALKVDTVKRKIGSKSENVAKRTNTRRKKMDIPSSDSESEIDLPDEKTCSSDDCDIGFGSDESDDGIGVEVTKLVDSDVIGPSDYVLVKFPTKKTVRYCVGQVVKEDEAFEYLINFLRRRGNRGFNFPNVEDSAIVNRQDIIGKLPKPSEKKGTTRVQSYVQFNINLEQYDIL